jgi:DNA-binding transcriptional LysR family regulator
MRLVVYASPKYLSEHGTPRHPRDLVDHNCLISRTSTDPDHWRFRIKGKETAIPVQGTFHANSPRAIAHMALAGAGIAMGPLYAVTPFLGRKRLRLLFEAHEATALGLYAVYPTSRHLSARVRALIDHLATTFSGEPYS